MNLDKEIFDISLIDIMPNRFQPREIFDDDGLKELSESIRVHGVIQPIIVRKVGDKYEIIAGERRFRASQLAGKETIPALVRDIDDKEAAKIALLENLQRRDLTPIEEAKTYQTILKLDNITQDELARNLGKSQSAIANKLRLLNLDEEVQTALLNSQISERHARSLLNLDLANQKKLLSRIINERLTVRQVDEEIMILTGRMPEASDDIEEQTNQVNINNSINEMVTGGVPAQNLSNNVTTPITSEIPNITASIPTPEANQVNNVIPTNNNIIDINTNEQNSFENNASEQPVITPVEISNSINNEPTQEQVIVQLETNKPKNIFDSLRVDVTNEEPIVNENNIEQEQSNESYNNVYDMRFAINNFRQAVQNTEKFGFKVNVVENDNPDTYQIVINIDKNK